MTEPSRAGANHEISLAVWDVPSPVVIGHRTTLKVGISCQSRCSLAGTAIEIRDEQGASIGCGRVGAEPWPGTMALYWVEIDVMTPATDGDRAWSIAAATADETHTPLTSVARVIACRPPEHRVTFEVIEKTCGGPLAGVELRVGAFRAATDDAGIACVAVPGATYDIGTWKLGYKVLSKTTDIARDLTIRLELIAVPEAEQPYWM